MGPRVRSGPDAVSLVYPHAATAFPPTKAKSELVMAAWRLYPDTITAFPSTRSKEHASNRTPSVPCRKTAPTRSSAQSPADGTPCGSMYV